MRDIYAAFARECRRLFTSLLHPPVARHVPDGLIGLFQRILPRDSDIVQKVWFKFAQVAPLPRQAHRLQDAEED